MTLPSPTYTTPLPLAPDRRGPRFYANIDNRLEVSSDSSVWQVPIAVPTELFTFMREVANVPPSETVTLALDLIDEKYVFSMFAKGKLYVLWLYSARSVPAWLLSPDYRL